MQIGDYLHAESRTRPSFLLMRLVNEVRNSHHAKTYASGTWNHSSQLLLWMRRFMNQGYFQHGENMNRWVNPATQLGA